MVFLSMELWNPTLTSNRLLFALAVVLASVYALGCLKGWIRLRGVTLLFPEHSRVLRKYRLAYTFWGPLASLLSLWGFIRSLWSRTIEWRGIRYRMVSPKETVVLEETDI